MHESVAVREDVDEAPVVWGLQAAGAGGAARTEMLKLAFLGFLAAIVFLVGPVALSQQHGAPRHAVPRELRFANTFGDHMVLQAGAFVSVWGHGPGPGSLVSVASSANPTVVTTTTTANNTWHVRLPGVAAGSMAHTVTATSGAKSTTLRDVLFGDVWVCSGQVRPLLSLCRSC